MLLLDAPRPPSCGWRRPPRCATVCRASPSFGWSATAAPPFLLPQVHVAATAAQAEALLARHVCALQEEPPTLVLGFDTESRPMGLGGTGRLALLQLATPTAVVLLPLLRFGGETPPSLARLLASPALLCGVSSHEDAAALAAAAAAPRAMRAVAVDVATAAARHRVAGDLGGERVGLAALVAALGGPSLAKPREVTLSNWEKWPLSAAQVSYAALDAFASGWAAAALHARLAERPGGAAPLTDWLRAEADT